MTLLRGRGLVAGKSTGKALVTTMPVNFTAALTKPKNLWRRALMQDRHHELYNQDLSGKVLVFPACVGSTYTGMVLLELCYRRSAPAAMVVQQADPLLVSGGVLAATWFGLDLPMVEYAGADLFERIRSGDWLQVDGGGGTIRLGQYLMARHPEQI